MKKKHIIFLIVLCALFIKQDITVIHAEETTMGVIINEETFPDDALRKYIIEVYDLDKNDYLTEDEIVDVKKLFFAAGSDESRKTINLKGVSYFKNLEDVWFWCKKIENQSELEKLPLLKELKLSSRQKKFDASKYPNLEVLVLEMPLTKLDISKNSNLKKLNLYEHRIKKYTLKNMRKLEKLNISAIVHYQI